jgi:hypothetical protein
MACSLLNVPTTTTRYQRLSAATARMSPLTNGQNQTDQRIPAQRSGCADDVRADNRAQIVRGQFDLEPPEDISQLLGDLRD